MKRFTVVLAAVFAISCLASTPLLAEGYVGLSYGESSADMNQSDIDDGSLSDFTSDDTDNAWKVFGGWHMKWVGVEAAWQDLGEFAMSADSDGSGPIYDSGPVTRTLEARGLSAELLGRIPLGKVIAIFGKVGALWWDSKMLTTGGIVRVSQDQSGFDLMYGAGVDIIIKKISLRLEYERFDNVSSADTAIDFASVGVMVNF
jgi:hypothetical protein